MRYKSFSRTNLLSVRLIFASIVAPELRTFFQKESIRSLVLRLLTVDRLQKLISFEDSCTQAVLEVLSGIVKIY